MLSAHLPPALTLEGLFSPRAQGFSSCTSWHPRSLLRLEFPREGVGESPAGGRRCRSTVASAETHLESASWSVCVQPLAPRFAGYVSRQVTSLLPVPQLRPLHIRGDDRFCPVEYLAMPGKQLEHTLAQGRAPLFAEDHAAPHLCPPGGTDWPRLPTACSLPCGARAAVGEAGVRGCGRAAGCGGASPSRRAALGGRRLGALRPRPPLGPRFSRRGR